MAVLTLRPTGDGLCALTCSTGTSHYSLVDETPAEDSDFVYLDGKALGYSYTSDFYTMGNHTTEEGDISSVKVCARMKKIMANTGDGCPTKIELYIGSTLLYLDNTITITNDWAIHTVEFLENPDTLDPWTWADIDALLVKIGFQIGELTGGGYCSQLYIEVTYEPEVTTSSFFMFFG